jgi:hypothetical protein
MCPQGFANERAAAFACRAVGSRHCRDRRPKAEFAKPGEDLHVVVETALAQFVPRDFAGGVLADQDLSFIGLHDNASCHVIV